MGCKATTNSNQKYAKTAHEKSSKDSVKVSFVYNGVIQGKEEERNLDEKLLEVIQENLKGKVNFSENGKILLGQIEKELSESKDTKIRSLLDHENKQSGHSLKLEEENGKVIIKITLHGLQNLASNIEEAYHKTYILAKPKETENQIVIYDSKTNARTFEKLDVPEGKTIYFYTSAYCNGENHLYVSGGENGKDEISDNFYDIDLVTKKVFTPKTKLSQPRSLHSMIYVPNNYVFIVGGRTLSKVQDEGKDKLVRNPVKEVEYYSINKKEIFTHSVLNQERIEPGLIVVDNKFLYAFETFKLDEKNIDTFERINLRSDDKKWELITPKIKIAPTETIKVHYYSGVSYHSSGTIVILGGQGVGDDEKCFLYEHETNTARLSDFNNKEYEFQDRFFLPLKPGNNYQIPNFEGEDFKIIRYVANEGLKEVDDVKI